MLCFAAIILISGMEEFSSAIFRALRAKLDVVWGDKAVSEYISPTSSQEVKRFTLS